MRPHKKKGQKVKAKPLPIEINQDEYVELLKVTEFMHHKVYIVVNTNIIRF